jgi:KaiC/GvpD/RAD55 family RecA-like ATPase
MESTEALILRNLIYNEGFTRKVLPFIKIEYFIEPNQKVLYDEISEFVLEYNSLPTPEALYIELEKRTDLNEEAFANVTKILSSLSNEPAEKEWLIKTTEQWCKDRAVYLAIRECIQIADGNHSALAKESIPSILSDALAVSFDSNIGHDYLEDSNSRYDSYVLKEEKLPFDLSYLNKITDGGLSPKTLNVILAGCVHPYTKVRIRYNSVEKEWTKKEVAISEIQTLLDNSYEVEIDSADGYVPVNFFIHKGIYEEYVLYIKGHEPIRCNADHLFETSCGWLSAETILNENNCVIYLTDKGYKYGKVVFTGNKIPIVDLNVNHPNHRYYTNGVSSHNTGVGKSLGMCHFAASYLIQGKNVLYITLEMSEDKIAQRIDANLLDVNIQDISKLSKGDFENKVQRLSAKTHGKLLIKEYPPTTAHSGHFRALINEMKLKKSFLPDVLIVDYINICASSRFKNNGQVNTYSMIKSIAEELRSLAFEFSIPVITATQTHRGGYSSSDVALTDTSESFGLPQTADFMIALISTEELENLNQILVKQLKNRYGALDPYRRFTIGIDRSKMRLYDVEQEAQETLIQEVDLEPEKKDFKAKFKNFNF